MDNNYIEERGAVKIIQALETNKKIIDLGLSLRKDNNHISYKLLHIPQRIKYNRKTFRKKYNLVRKIVRSKE